ncbi:MAG TPA: hypothetical protein GXZ45_05500 [Propionibacterium sp.]|nr:hypothetical protein [Propionibacterium sp.]
MTDHDRAERALDRALRDHAGDHDFAPLAPETLKGDAPGGVGSRRRRPWLGAAVAAVVLVVASVPLAGLVSSMFNAESSAPMTAEAHRADSAAGGAAPEAAPAQAPEPAGGRAVAPAGWRWESMLDASVAVPGDWGYGFAPGSDWCAEPGHQRPERPFVDRNPVSRFVRAIACPEEVPAALRQVHLTWRHTQPGDVEGATPVGSSGEWLRVGRVVGSAYLVVEVPAAELALAEQVLATAQENDVDPRGCPVVNPEVAPSLGAIADLATASELVVCQYSGAERPNLVGSYALTGDEAQGVLDAVLATPESPAVPDDFSCGDPGSGLLLRFDGTRAVWIDMSGCGPFVLDDGVTTRTPTRATCGDLLTGPLWIPGTTASQDACQPVR